MAPCELHGAIFLDPFFKNKTYMRGVFSATVFGCLGALVFSLLAMNESKSLLAVGSRETHDALAAIRHGLLAPPL